MTLFSEAPTSVFISCSRIDSPWVERKLIPDLKQLSCKYWYFRESIPPGRPWNIEVLKGMQQSEWFVLIASNAATRSEHVKDEVDWAVKHRPDRIVILLLEPCDLYSIHLRLARLQITEVRDHDSDVGSATA